MVSQRIYRHGRENLIGFQKDKMADNAFTYADSAMREDLLSVVTNLSPKSTQLSSGLATSTAKAIRHEWLERALSAVKGNAYVEGADASYAVIEPSRTINYCQILRQGYQVTDTDADVTRATGDRMAEERTDAMAIIKNDLELALLQGSLVCGSSTVARRMNGIASWIVATNVTIQSGISLNESTFVGYMERVWNYGGEVDEVYVGSTLKKRIDGFTAGATKNVNSDDKRLVAAVDVYESSFAPLVKIFLHRYANEQSLTKTIANANNIYGITSKYYRVAYLRKPFTRPLAKAGDSEKEEIVMEATLEDLVGGKAGFIGQDHF